MAGRKRNSYELWFSVNDTAVSTQLQNIDKSLRNTTSEYKLLKTNLSGAWDTANWKRAQQISSKAVEDTALKVKLLKDRLAEMEREGVTDGTREAVEKLRREIVAAENAAQIAKKRLQEIDNLKMENIKKTIKEVSANLTAAGKTLTMGVTLPLAAAGAASIKMSADMQESINKVDVSFGSAAKSVHEFSNITLMSYGIAKSTALEMAGYFGDMATSSKFSQEEAAKMSIQLVGLAGDLASFKNISLSEAKTALSAIFTGETESLKKLGIVMTQTNLDAFALEKGIKKTTQEMTENEKISLRMAYIFEKTANSQGDFARTSDSTANQLRLLTESLKELAAIAGDELIPIVTPIIQNLNDLIQKVGDLDDGTKDIIVKTAIFAAAFGPLLTVTGKATGAVTALISAYQAVRAALAAKQAADSAATTSQVALNTAMAANPAGAIAAAIGVLIAVIGSLAITSALTGEKVETLGDKVKKTAKDFDDAAASIKDNADSQNAELDVIAKLIPRYDELNKKTNKTAQEKAELKSIVDEINRVMPNTISLINAEKGQYDALASSIYGTVEARKAEIESIANRDRAIEAQKSQQSLLEKLGFTDIKQAQTELNKLKSSIKAGEFTGSFLDQVWYEMTGEKSGTSKAVENQIKAIELAITEYQKYQTVIEKYTKVTSAGGSKTNYLENIDGGGKEKTAEEIQKEKLNRALSDIEFAYESHSITLNQYISKLTAYRDKYLSSDIYAWRDTTLKIQSLRENAAAAEKKRLEEIAAAEKEKRKQQLADAEEFANKAISLAEQEANAKIAAIDAELAARDKLKAQQEQELQLQQAMAQLAFTRDEDSRVSLQREIDRLKYNINESNIRAEADAQKAAIQSEIERLKQNASSMISQMQASVTPEVINPYITQLAPNLTVNASGLTAAQAQQLIMQAFNKMLYSI